MKILMLDLETSPNVAHVWGLWQQNVSLNQLRESTEVICWGAQWYGQKKVMFRSVHHDGKKAMLEEIHRLLDEADAVMGWNSKSFDAKHLSREFFEAGMAPPSPYQHIDLMLTARKRFRFPSNKLDYVAGVAGIGHKVKHSGHDLWVRCLAGEDKAWQEMKRYQVQDVRLLGPLYERLLPWIDGHPNAALFDGDSSTDRCTKCNSDDVQYRGWARTSASTFRQIQCNKCKSWSRLRRREHGVNTAESR